MYSPRPRISLLLLLLLFPFSRHPAVPRSTRDVSWPLITLFPRHDHCFRSGASPRCFKTARYAKHGRNPRDTAAAAAVEAVADGCQRLRSCINHPPTISFSCPCTAVIVCARKIYIYPSALSIPSPTVRRSRFINRASLSAPPHFLPLIYCSDFTRFSYTPARASGAWISSLSLSPPAHNTRSRIVHRCSTRDASLF